MIPFQKVAPVSVLNDVSSCTVYQYSIVPRVDVSTAHTLFLRFMSNFYILFHILE